MGIVFSTVFTIKAGKVIPPVEGPIIKTLLFIF